MITSLIPIFASSQRTFEFITALTPGTLRNDFPGYVGGTINPQRNMVVTHLGRYVNAGNSQTHLLTLWNATDSVLVAQTSISCAGAPVGFNYVSLSTAAALIAGKTYILTSEEFASGDTWQNFDSVVTVSADFAAPSSIFSSSPTSGFTVDVGDAFYVPLNLKYY
jgi:hypothetical protein